MAPAVCPNGHTSDSTDYCDTCGSPIGSSGGAAPAPSASAPSTPGSSTSAKPLGVVCPNCGIMNAPGALFCEACGYDYTTGTMPRSPEPSVLDLDAPLPEASPTAETDAASSPVSAEAAAPSTPAPAGSSLDLDAPTPQAPATASPPSAPGPPARAGDAPTTTPPEMSSRFDWVLELWVDPEWYALQDSPDPMPSAGLPEIVPLRKESLLIGRPSRSRNIRPDIDCEPDTGISRRQAQLTTDGTRWFIEDLDSANGTFVAAAAAGAMPDTPLTPGRRRELSGDERIYLGAWTRLVLRRATPEEQEAYAAD